MIWTALPCTTPRPAPESSACDLASDLWASARHEAGPHFVRATRAERGRVVNRPIPRRRSRDRGSRINSTDQAIVPQTKGRNPSPRSELYSVAETGLVVAYGVASNPLVSTQLLISHSSCLVVNVCLQSTRNPIGRYFI